jgi:hypothetical protein
MRENGASRIAGELGDVFVGRGRIPQDGSTVALDVSKGLLGKRDIVVRGLKSPTII